MNIFSIKTLTVWYPVSARAGEGWGRRFPSVVLVALVLTVVGCEGPAAVPAAATTPVEAAETAPWVETEPDAEGWIGVVVAGESVEVTPDLQGRLAAVLVGVGDTVDRGQVVARMDRDGLRQELNMAQAALSAARAEVDRLQIERSEAEVRYERRTGLGELVSQEEISEARLAFERTRTAVRVAEARVEEAEAREEQLLESLRRTEVRAPFPGRVTLRHADPGAMVGPNQPILTVSSGSLRVRFAVPPEEAVRLAEGQSVWGVCCEPRRTTPLVIERVAPQIDLAAQMVVVEAAFADEGHSLRNGQDVRVVESPEAAGLGSGVEAGDALPSTPS